MKVEAAILTSLLASSFFIEPVAAEWRCDCTTVVDSCAADVELQENWVTITTDHPQCARVDYFIDGLPFVSLVVEGEGREDWIADSSSPQVIVQSCQVCIDNSVDGEFAERSADTVAAVNNGALEPLVETTPEYPALARAQGVEGSVTVEFVVTPVGAVENARVAAAEPAGMFDLSALSAITRWRYPADPNRDPQPMTETIAFSLTDFIWDLPTTTAGTTSTGARLARSLNQCVRESVSYNYGEMIETGLMNACNDPLIVFACSVGTGSYADRWVCVDSEAQTSLLVAPGRAPAGGTNAIASAEGTRAFGLTDRLFIARSPNTEYWWLACNAADLPCRSEGRQWVRAIDRQTANIDPQQRTQRNVGRSH